MKAKIHPKYNEAVTVTCSCGRSFKVGSTESELKIEVCSNCHPFYTGKQKLVDVGGRIDKFKQRLKAAEKSETKRPAKKPKRRKKAKDTTVSL